eukprot:TRINITY_DN280_c0_g2_i12.p1 TRINITY_DN280_c0_g2~~TRINITY_DN280_c0_g2_i12.p1  ORF type:complete len:305 (+),score=136.79 TRINITY_DN280_c0_g2_i12:3-917(+)
MCIRDRYQRRVRAKEERERRATERMKEYQQELNEQDSSDDENVNTSSVCFGLFRSKKKNGINSNTTTTTSTTTTTTTTITTAEHHRFFGVALTDVFSQPELLSIDSGLQCPIVIAHCVNSIRERLTIEGLFRVSGSWGEIANLKGIFERGEIPDLSKVDVHSVSSLLDLYFRQLPDPLLTRHLYDNFIGCKDVEDVNLKLMTVQRIIFRLPEAHLNVLRLMLPFLRAIADQSESNKMDAKNLGLIFGPILMGGEEALSLLQIQKIKAQATLIELMIIHCHDLLGAPASAPTSASTSTTTTTTLS